MIGSFHSSLLPLLTMNVHSHVLRVDLSLGNPLPISVSACDVIDQTTSTALHDHPLGVFLPSAGCWVGIFHEDLQLTRIPHLAEEQPFFKVQQHS